MFAWLSAEFEDLALLVIVTSAATAPRCGSTARSATRAAKLVRSSPSSTTSGSTTRAASSTGRFVLTDARRRVWEVEVEPAMRLYLSGAGYTAGPRRRGHLGEPFWTEKWDLSDREDAEARKLNDNVCHMRCGERQGHGIVETLLGAHERYVVRERELLELASFCAPAPRAHATANGG